MFSGYNLPSLKTFVVRVLLSYGRCGFAFGALDALICEMPSG